MTDASRYPMSHAMRRFVEQTEAFFNTSPTLAEQRSAYRRMAAAFTPPRPKGVSSQDIRLGAGQSSVHVRRYQPAGKTPSAGWPTLLYAHGGGWYLGDLDSHDFITAALCASLSAVVIAIDYRLAPEHPFPAALDDCLVVWQAVQAQASQLHLARHRIAVLGDSAGGNLMAALCLRLRDRGGSQPCGQVLLYPALSHHGDYPSYRQHAHAPLLSRGDMQASLQHYLATDTKATDDQAGPAEAASLANLPPAFIAVAEYDPLCDEGMQYAARIQAEGGQARLYLGRQLVHGCLRARASCPEVEDLYQAMLAELRDMLARPASTQQSKQECRVNESSRCLE